MLNLVENQPQPAETQLNQPQKLRNLQNQNLEKVHQEAILDQAQPTEKSELK